MSAYSPEILAEAKRRGTAPYVVYIEKKNREQEFIMAQSPRQEEVKLESATLMERIVAASLGTVALLYGVFLGVDLLMGWGLGFTVLWYTLGTLAVLGAVIAIAALWRWVYKGSGRFQMSDS